MRDIHAMRRKTFRLRVRSKASYPQTTSNLTKCLSLFLWIGATMLVRAKEA